LSATLEGITGAVTWTMEGTSGRVSGDGVFTAPETTGSYTVIARSVSDPTVTGRATIVVTNAVNVRFSFAGRGDVVLRLNMAEAPNTSANLVSLVNRGFYNGIWVHRVEPNFVVQWGDPNTIGRTPGEPGFTPGTGGPGYTIPFETNSLLHTQYALGMARGTARDSGGSQIYICLQAQPGLDGDYVVFGETIAGQSLVDTLAIGDTISSAVTEVPAP
jgi:cyclophilin family peptidyl-prolyl cis-trans isomerase